MSNYLSERWLIDRRHVLRGMGTAIALPWLNCMQSAKASVRRDSSRPSRCVFVYVPNGVNTLTWQIERGGKRYQLTAPLKSLERHRAHITPISGLHHPSGIGKAHRCDQIWLTGAKIGNDPSGFRNSISADQLIAEAVGVDTRFPSLELAVTGGTLAWNRQGVPLPAERKPSEVFQRLFGQDANGKKMARQVNRRRSSVLDLVLDEARGFRKALGTEDRSKLDEYLQSVREVERRTERADTWWDRPAPAIDQKSRSQLSRNIPDSEAGDYYRAMYDLMVLALRTDMTRVITCMSGSEGRGLAIPEIGIVQSRHELSHHNGDPAQMDRLSQCDAFLTEQFSYFLDKLQSYQEQSESLLDRTMVLYGSGMSYGHSHGNANLPIVLAGGKSLGLRHGQHLDFNLPVIGDYRLSDSREHYRICTRPVDANARLCNVLLLMIQKMGVAIESFGDSVDNVPAIGG